MAKGEARKPRPRPQAQTPGHWRRPWTLPPSLLASNSPDDEGWQGIKLWPHKAYLKDNPQRNLTVLVYVNADLSTSKLLVMLYDCVKVSGITAFQASVVSLTHLWYCLITHMYLLSKIFVLHSLHQCMFLKKLYKKSPSFHCNQGIGLQIASVLPSA